MPYLNPLSLADLRERLQHRWEGVPWWDTDDADDAINETLIWWNLFTGVWRRRETIDLGSGNNDYALSGSLTYPLRVELEGRPLAPAAVFGLDNAKPGWQSQRTTTGNGVPTRVEVWAPVSLMEIVVWPTPVNDADLGTLIVDGVSDTPRLLSDSDALELDESWLSPLLGFALHLAAFSLGGPRWRATFPFRTDFFAACLQQNERLTRSQLLRTYAGLDLGRLQRPLGGAGQDGTASSSPASPASTPAPQEMS